MVTKLLSQQIHKSFLFDKEKLKIVFCLLFELQSQTHCGMASFWTFWEDFKTYFTGSYNSKYWMPHQKVKSFHVTRKSYFT